MKLLLFCFCCYFFCRRHRRLSLINCTSLSIEWRGPDDLTMPAWPAVDGMTYRWPTPVDLPLLVECNRHRRRPVDWFCQSIEPVVAGRPVHLLVHLLVTWWELSVVGDFVRLKLKAGRWCWCQHTSHRTRLISVLLFTKTLFFYRFCAACTFGTVMMVGDDQIHLLSTSRTIAINGCCSGTW